MTLQKIALGAFCKFTLIAAFVLASSTAFASGVLDNSDKEQKKDAFFAACLRGKTEDVLASIKNGDFDISWRNDDGTSPLGSAILRYNQDPAMIRALVEAGFEINGCVGSALLPELMMAISNNDTPEIMEIFLKAGVDPNVRGVGGKTPAHLIAARKKPSEFIETLSRYGGKIDLPDEYGKTPIWELYEARAELELYKTFKKLGANFEHPDLEGGTMLMRSELPELIKILSAAGADMNARDVSEKTALIRAVAFGASLELIEALIEGGSDLNARDSSGRSALIYAVIKGRPDVESLLRQNAADDTIKDNDGKCAFDYTPEGMAKRKKRN